MSVSGVLRIGEAELRVLDLEESVIHYRDRIGLQEMARDDDGRVYFKCWDEWDHHSIVIREGDEPGLDYIAYKVMDDAALTDYEKRVRDYGFEVESIDAGVYLKSGRRIQFTIPSGHVMQLYAEKEKVGNNMSAHNPEVIPDEGVIRGMGPTRLDHVLVYGPNVPECGKFFKEVLDFELAEEIVKDGTDDQISVFMACSNKPHDIAWVNYPEPGKLHHISFYLNNEIDVYHAGDIIGKNRISNDIGPTRHGITRGATIYFFDPSGNRNEVFSGGYIRYPDNPPLRWDESQLGPAIFYHDGKLNEAFLSVVT